MMAQIIVELDSIDEDIFVCGACKSIFNSLQKFLDHKSTPCNGRSQSIIQGNVLQTYDSNPEQETTAVTDITEKESIFCNICKKNFNKLKSLLAHLKIHSDKPYQCTICGRCFIQNSHLQRHIVSHKVWPDGLSETTAKSPEVELLSYSCQYCSMVLASYPQFRAHLKIHQNLKKYKCIQPNCSCFFQTLQLLLYHVSIDHNPPMYYCHICYETFNTLETIASHQQSHNESERKELLNKSQQYKCLQCDAIFKKPEKLSLHMLTENHKKICIHCNKTFSSDKRLRLHLHIHRKTKTYQCNFCLASFHMKKYLSSHMLSHGEKQFVCTVCDHKFRRQDLLQRHMKSHEIKKPFKCPFKDTLDCRKEFSRKDKLKSHIKSHTNHMTFDTNIQTSSAQSYSDAGTLEICIVPVDT